MCVVTFLCKNILALSLLGGPLRTFCNKTRNQRLSRREVAQSIHSSGCCRMFSSSCRKYMSVTEYSLRGVPLGTRGQSSTS